MNVTLRIFSLLLLCLTAQAATVISGSGNITMSGNISFTAPTPAADTTAPYVTGASLAANGTTIYVTNSEAMQRQAASGSFTNNQSQAMTYSSGSNTTVLVYTVPTAIASNVTVTLGNTNAAGWHDAATNYLAVFGATNVSNNSTQGASTYLLSENWGATYPWTITGTTANTNYTGIDRLDGDASLLLEQLGADVVAVSTPLDTKSEYWGYFMFFGTNGTLPNYIECQLFATAAEEFYVLYYNGTWYAKHGGTVEATDGAGLTEGHTNHVWWHYKAASAYATADGEYHLYVNTNAAYKGDARIALTNGLSTNAINKVNLTLRGMRCIVDKLIVNTNDVPVNP